MLKMWGLSCLGSRTQSARWQRYVCTIHSRTPTACPPTQTETDCNMLTLPYERHGSRYVNFCLRVMLGTFRTGTSSGVGCSAPSFSLGTRRSSGGNPTKVSGKSCSERDRFKKQNNKQEKSSVSTTTPYGLLIGQYRLRGHALRSTQKKKNVE